MAASASDEVKRLNDIVGEWQIGVMSGTLTFGAGTWTHEWGMAAEGKPAKLRLTLTEMTPAGGKWKDELSMAGGPWVTTGEGTYSKAK